ncbi:RNA polymerase sigma factor [Paenibacillus albiflavus]|uniref:RNA polymerase sigma factor n=1 Tax=Paenibacillus albiflavus TaxID=2545760 RepID=A0A4R4DZ23_9BACL|nr:RNA polymerase sigma factor [Paenibacillus albiflavus]TCZ68879.1 RNA polymerase sigma factor [Paenibacillus albiflavus]
MKTELQKIGEDSKQIWAAFMDTVRPFREDLWNYCRKITGSPWEAEDLLQDTLLKTFGSLSAISHRGQPLQAKSYLFRVATNHWIDQCRKRRVPIDSLDEATSIEPSSVEDQTRPVIVNEAIELLVRQLPAKQVVVLILMESYHFTAPEIASLLATTENAVHATLRRARSNIRKLRDCDFIVGTESDEEESTIHKEVVQRFIDLYNKYDFRGLASLIDDHAVYSFVAMSSKEYGKSVITKASLNPDRERRTDIKAMPAILWGRAVLLFTIIDESGNVKALFDINSLEVQDGKIVYWSCYYFCREFMNAAADELGLPLEPVIWS